MYMSYREEHYWDIWLDKYHVLLAPKLFTFKHQYVYSPYFSVDISCICGKTIKSFLG